MITAGIKMIPTNEFDTCQYFSGILAPAENPIRFDSVLFV